MRRIILTVVLLQFFVLFNAYAEDMGQLKAQVKQIIKENIDELHQEVINEFKQMDVDHNGYVSEVEFINFQSYGTREQKSQAFKMMDGNHDGHLTQKELWSFMKKKIDSF